MLRITGKVLDVSTEHITPTNGESFDSTTITLHTGGKFTEQVRVGRDFKGDLPNVGAEAELVVFVSAYQTRNGAGYRFTATENVAKGARVAAPALAG